MKRILLLAALFCTVYAAAQTGTPYHNAITNEGRAPYRTEFISYDIRKEADEFQRKGSKYYLPLTFKVMAGVRPAAFEAEVNIPALWLDREVYIRDEGRTGRYRLWVNGREAGFNTDSYGTNDYYVTPYLKEGVNELVLEFNPAVAGADMEAFTFDASRQTIENLYIYSQPRIHVFDYIASGYPDPESGDAILALDIIMANGFNMPETVTVGYDVYDPAGKLKEYTFNEVTIPGRSTDTVRFRNKIFGTEKYQYSSANPALYKVVLSVKHQGRNTEYIPFKVGFGTTGFDGTNVIRNGQPVRISAVEYDAASSRQTVLAELRQLKKRGINTLYLLRPQQAWFYDMCQAEGLYVIDRAAVQCDPRGGDRGPDGTVANNPEYLDRFLDRQQNMFYRNRNRPNVIGWSIGSDSGNGYNMYKSYQWMKQADPVRVVVYPYAGGEWNTDTELPAPKQ